MKTKGFLICFTGIDGTGKTTLAKLLVNSIKKQGVKCVYTYGRSEDRIAMPFFMLGKFLFLKGKDIKRYDEYSNAKKEAIGKHPVLSILYQNILFFDYFFQILIKIISPMMLGKIVVCDRYVYDTVINDIPRSDNSMDKIRLLLGKCFHIAPKPDIAFLIDVPEEIAYQRKNDTPSIGYLRERRKIYLEIGKEYGMVILDGTKNLEELKIEIDKVVFR